MAASLSAPRLPLLRQELQIRPGAPLVTGAPSWTVFDPLRHLFFQIGQIEFRIYSLWSCGHIGSVQSELVASDGLSDEDAQKAIRNVLEFSLANSLTV